jgi:hypothetical protein
MWIISLINAATGYCPKAILATRRFGDGKKEFTKAYLALEAL